MSGRADEAERLFREGYNCSQAVVGAFSDVIGVPADTAIKISAPFGGGFGRLREVCGACCGMTFVLGALRGYSEPGDYAAKKELYAREQALMGEFASVMGSYVCREILGSLAEGKGGAPTPRTEEFYVKRPCLRCIRAAADILERELSRDGAEG